MAAEPSYRRPLTQDQINTLKIIYEFRFISAAHLASLNGQYKSVVYSRLKILHDQGYLGRKYDSSYRLLGKPAAYYLLPKAIKLLKDTSQDSPYTHPKVIRNMAKNHLVSQEFIDHSLTTLAIFAKLKALYGPEFSKRWWSRTKIAHFDFFLTPRPDAYFYIKPLRVRMRFVLENIEEATPWFAMKRRIDQYIDHIDEGGWDDSGLGDYPSVLLVCETDKLYKRLKQHIQKRLEQTFAADLLFGLTTKQELLSSTTTKDKIWLPVSDEIGSLSSLSKLRTMAKRSDDEI